ncbi:TIGR04211 family SH3 domain-containing protein [Thalassotalea sp. PLHSN55]|uniref:TIGR04211 family SH3 domain-containing protein n=1 Tax=Thalassotalea sp. PLHSN55 TaxID=3435888 RepID=UPI003F84194F
MNFVKSILSLVLFSFSLSLAAQEEPANMATGFISDDLFIYMHAGAGTNYRILGTINAGTEIKITGQSSNDYSEIVDTKGRLAWVESKYVSTKPGLRNVIAELNTQMASSLDDTNRLNSNLSANQEQIVALKNSNTELQNNLAALNNELIETKAKLKDQDTNIKKEYFYNGAIVLSIGLLLGIILPRLGGRKKANMDSWK